MNLKDAYNILSLPPNSELPNERVLKKAYRKSSLLHHPDRNLGDPDASERFQQVGAAYAYIIQARDGGTDELENDEDHEEEEDGDDYHRDFDDSADPDEDRIDGMAWDYEHDLPAWATHGRQTRDEREQEDDDKEIDLMREHFTGEHSTRNDRRFFARMEKKYALKKKKRDRLAEERRLAIAAKKMRDKHNAAFWARQRRCGSEELSVGGVGCYLHWHPRKLQREFNKRKLKNTNTKSEDAIAWFLLEDDERNFTESRQGYMLQNDSNAISSRNKLHNSMSTSVSTSTLTPATPTSSSTSLVTRAHSRKQKRNKYGESSLSTNEAARRKIIAGRERKRRGIHPSQLEMLQDANGMGKEAPMMLQDGPPSVTDPVWNLLGSIGSLVSGVSTMLGITSSTGDDDTSASSSSTTTAAATATAAASAAREKRKQERMEEDLAVKEWREEQRLNRQAKLAAKLARQEKQRRREEVSKAGAAVRKAKEDAKAAQKQTARDKQAHEEAEVARERKEQEELWSTSQQQKLESALKKFPKKNESTSRERWTNIAEMVGDGMTKKQCAERYKFLRREVKRAQQYAETTAQTKLDELSAMTPTERAKLERDAARKKEKKRRRDVERMKNKILAQNVSPG